MSGFPPPPPRNPGCTSLVPQSIIVIIITAAAATFMQGIYNCIPETNHVSRVCSIAVILYLQFTCMIRVMLFPMLGVLYFYISSFRSMRVVASMAVLCIVLLLLSSSSSSSLIIYILGEHFSVNSSHVTVVLYCIWFTITL